MKPTHSSSNPWKCSTMLGKSFASNSARYFSPSSDNSVLPMHGQLKYYCVSARRVRAENRNSDQAWSWEESMCLCKLWVPPKEQYRRSSKQVDQEWNHKGAAQLGRWVPAKWATHPNVEHRYYWKSRLESKDPNHCEGRRQVVNTEQYRYTSHA